MTLSDACRPEFSKGIELFSSSVLGNLAAVATVSGLRSRDLIAMVGGDDLSFAHVAETVRASQIVDIANGIHNLQSLLDEFAWGIWPNIWQRDSISFPLASISAACWEKMSENLLDALLNPSQYVCLRQDGYSPRKKSLEELDTFWWAQDSREESLPTPLSLGNAAFNQDFVLLDDHEIVSNRWQSYEHGSAKIPSALVYRVDQLSDWVELCKRYPQDKSSNYPLSDRLGAPAGWVTADMDLVRRDYVAVEVTVRGFFNTAYRLVKTDRQVPCVLMGWHPGSILWLR